jgi:hypothetical protein
MSLFTKLLTTMLWLAFVVAEVASAQNVILNSAFDSTIDGWVSYPATTGGGASWYGADGIPSPGSLQLLNPGACDCQARAEYCAVIEPNSPYIFRYEVKDSGQSQTSWSGSSSVGLYSDIDCAEMISSPLGEALSALPQGAWSERILGAAVAPPNAHSARVTFAIANTGGSGISLLFDNVRLLDDGIFISGFE